MKQRRVDHDQLCTQRTANEVGGSSIKVCRLDDCTKTVSIKIIIINLVYL